jgi:hypothetical protein
LGASFCPHLNIPTTLELEPMLSLRRDEFRDGVVVFAVMVIKNSH